MNSIKGKIRQNAVYKRVELWFGKPWLISCFLHATKQL